MKHRGASSCCASEEKGEGSSSAPYVRLVLPLKILRTSIALAPPFATAIARPFGDAFAAAFAGAFASASASAFAAAFATASATALAR